MSGDTDTTHTQMPEPPKTDTTRQRILRAAGQAFGERGYARATTRAIAQAASVNEVTLFRHFGTKQALFAAVIEHFAAPALTSAIEAQLTGDYRQDLLHMGRVVAHTLLERQDGVRLMLCEAGHFSEVRDVMARNPRLLRQTLARYLETQMERGLVRPLHAEAAAQLFWGMFFSYAISQGLLGETVHPELSLDQIIIQFVDIFIAGTAAAPVK
jgi:AcrR family transcriptional regulator